MRRHPLRSNFNNPNYYHQKNIYSAIRDAKESLNIANNYKINLNESHKVQPFTKHKIKIDKSLSVYAKNNTPATIFINEFQRLLSMFHQDSLIVYTDGSKIGSQTSSAYFNNENQKGFRLHDFATIFTAEIFGILMAIKTNIRSNRDILVCTDSLSSVHDLNKINFNQMHPTTLNIHKLVNLYHKKVTVM